LKPIRSSALTKAQKAKGAGLLNDDALSHFGESAAALPSYIKAKGKSRSTSPEVARMAALKAKKNGQIQPTAAPSTKPKVKAKGDETDGDTDAESGDEAELLDENQLNELEDIYKRC
jgi:hypothetical protein